MNACLRGLRVFSAVILAAGLATVTACGSSGASGAGGSSTTSTSDVGCMQYWAVCTCTCDGVAVEGLLGFASSCTSLEITTCGDGGTADDGGDAGSLPRYEGCVQTGLQPDC